MPGDKGPHHSDAWHRCVEKVGERGNVDSPEAVCTWSLERTGATYEEEQSFDDHVKSKWGSVDKMVEAYKSEKKKKEDDFGSLPEDLKKAKIDNPRVPVHKDIEDDTLGKYDREVLHRGINKKELEMVYNDRVRKAESLLKSEYVHGFKSENPNQVWYRQTMESLSPFVKNENLELASANIWGYTRTMPIETVITKMEDILKSRKPWYADPYLTSSPEKSKVEEDLEADVKVVQDAIEAHKEVIKAFKELDEK